GDFAEKIYKDLSKKGHNVFIDINSIKVGEVWSNTIAENISKCDIFIIIITYGSLDSPYVEREVKQAQEEEKKIIPCIQRDIDYEKIKWNLESLQGIEFDDKFELARKLYSRINTIDLNNTSSKENNSSKTIVDSNKPISKTIVDSNKPISKTIVDSNKPISKTIVDSNKPISKTIVDSNKPISKTIVDSTKFLKSNFKLILPITIISIAIISLLFILGPIYIN